MADFRKRYGKWQARIRWTDKFGKKHSASKAGFPTKQAAKNWSVSEENKLIKGVKINENVSFASYYSDWLEKYKKPKLADWSYERYSEVLKIIKSYFSQAKLKSINRSDYQEFINWYGKNHALNSVRKVNGPIHQCVNSAILDGYIYRDFTQNITLSYGEKAREVSYLSLEEIKKLLKEAEQQYKPRFYTSRYIIVTAIYTGMRLGEIQALTWNDIDFIHRTITISKSWNYEKKSFKPTKNEASNRTITINPKFVKILKELRNKSKSNMVFMNEFGTIPTSSSVNHCLNQLLNKLDINRENFHFHSLRHSHVALLLADGVDIYAISKRLGHSNVSTTSNIYAYLLDEYQEKSDDLIRRSLDAL
ncbi:MAG: tyrosine-type recombinase/integrase [Limosilactobacillus pontis]|uniref:tyrosine-type recombinase/integrase n=1 Tax=Limosilactobacillus pontis TaxID=35787 RepID=UPI0039A08F9D